MNNGEKRISNYIYILSFSKKFSNMKGSIAFVVLITMMIDRSRAKRLGHIRNGSYVSNDTKVLRTFVNTCSECICDGFFSMVSPVYVGLNCYQSRKTCELFANYSIPSMITRNDDSTFIFLQLPPVENKTTGTDMSTYENGVASTIDITF